MQGRRKKSNHNRMDSISIHPLFDAQWRRRKKCSIPRNGISLISWECANARLMNSVRVFKIKLRKKNCANAVWGYRYWCALCCALWIAPLKKEEKSIEMSLYKCLYVLSLPPRSNDVTKPPLKNISQANFGIKIKFAFYILCSVFGATKNGLSSHSAVWVSERAMILFIMIFLDVFRNVQRQAAVAVRRTTAGL